MIIVNEKEYIFEQKYCLFIIDECIFFVFDKEIFKFIISKGKILYIIFYFFFLGIGKIIVVKVLCYDVNVDMMFVNGLDCKIDFVCGFLINFVSVVLFDGC